MSKSSFRFHDSLNDFLLPLKRNTWIEYIFNDTPAIKHAIESIGIPHPEVDLIIINGAPVDFKYLLRDKDIVEVYPVLSAGDLAETGSLNRPFFYEKFILDVHLGKLAKILRLFGFDTYYKNDYDDKTIVQIAETEKRTVLTRDVNLLKHKSITIGYWLRSQFAEEQLKEVIRRFRLKAKFKPFERCVECNGKIIKIEKSAVLDKLLPKTILYYNDFFQCICCKRIYWRGSHYEQMQQYIERMQKLFY
ncbi:MAG TPA: Mut7-C RNAse domain-containing protein [Chitinophagaceae bacterium]